MPVDLFLDFSASPARGPSPITVVGESQDKTYAKTIEIRSFELGIENPTTIGSMSAGAGAGKAQFKPFTVTHAVDSASAPLFQALATGSHFPTVKLYVRRSGGVTPSAYLTYTFSMVFVTDINTSADAGSDLPQETVQMLYGAVQTSYQPSGTTGQPSGQPILGTWNQVTNNANPTIPNN